jgi:sialidase-1
MQNNWIFCFLACLLLSCSETSSLFEIQLFKNGDGDYACYRIPAIIKTPQGRLLAFAEGRKTSCNDFGNVDILLRTSNDGGIQWTEMEIVADFGELQAGNPAPMVDLFDPEYPEGRIFLFYNTGDVSEHDMRLGKGTREVHFITSVDQGKTWSISNNITNQVHFNSTTDQAERDWRTNATTPGHALQFKQPPYQGRIYVPANHSQGDPLDGYNEYRAYGFYSDDHGKTFQPSPDLNTPSSNEAIGVELPDGRLMLNVREQSGAAKKRLIALSSTAGEQWDTEFFDSELISPVCQSSILYFEGVQDSILLYSGPNSSNQRIKMTIKGSLDLGKSWSIEKEIYSGTSAYSDLVQVDAKNVGLFYERDNDGIYYIRLPIKDLTY